MRWTIKYTRTFQKATRKLDKQLQHKVKKFFEKLADRENPRSQGKPLASNLSGLWRYRIGDFRIICEIQDENSVILTLRIGHRKNIYKVG